MTGRRARVRLGDLTVGELVEDDRAVIEFRLDDAYARHPGRPVLGQWFEDRPREKVQSGERAGVLPPFFANLIPEGDLRVLIAERLEVPLHDDLGLLCAVGHDLPGALIVDQSDGNAPELPARPPSDDQAGLRFSLAGVQLKFSLVHRSDRFWFPGRDERGGWIAKISHDEFDDLAANEWTTMEWARQIGFDVPATELRRLDELVDLPHQGRGDSLVYLIARYDRDGARRIHQEDFQQVVGRPPEGKYQGITYDKLAAVASSVVPDGYDEFVRRLAFVAASGNNDAHMKNWSVIYPDGISARWSPLYDQVFTAQWPRFRKSLALKVDGTKEFAELDLRHFREFARRIGTDPDHTVAGVADVVRRAADTWIQVREHPSVPSAYREALREHWRRVPLLRPHALAI